MDCANYASHNGKASNGQHIGSGECVQTAFFTLKLAIPAAGTLTRLFSPSQLRLASLAAAIGC